MTDRDTCEEFTGNHSVRSSSRFQIAWGSRISLAKIDARGVVHPRSVVDGDAGASRGGVLELSEVSNSPRRRIDDHDRAPGSLLNPQIERQILACAARNDEVTRRDLVRRSRVQPPAAVAGAQILQPVLVPSAGDGLLTDETQLADLARDLVSKIEKVPILSPAKSIRQSCSADTLT